MNNVCNCTEITTKKIIAFTLIQTCGGEEINPSMGF